MMIDEVPTICRVAKVGDTVWLRSGSCSMTVDVVREDIEAVDCIWMHDGEIRSHSFLVDQLTTLEPR